jgi:hypothetical protein
MSELLFKRRGMATIRRVLGIAAALGIAVLSSCVVAKPAGGFTLLPVGQCISSVRIASIRLTYSWLTSRRFGMRRMGSQLCLDSSVMALHTTISLATVERPIGYR